MTNANKYILSFVLFLSLSLFSFTRGQEKKSLQEVQKLLAKSQRDSNRVKLLLEAGFLCLDTQNLSSRDVDSALYFSNLAGDLTRSLKLPNLEGKSLILSSEIYRNKQELQKGLACIQKVISGSTGHISKEDLGDGYLERAQYYDMNNDEEFKAVVTCYAQAARCYNQAGNREKYADALCMLGKGYIDLGESNSAKIHDTLSKALGVYQQIHSPKLHSVYGLFGQQYARIGSYNKALNYLQAAVKMAETVQDTGFGVVTIYSDLGMVYCQMHQFSKAYPYLEKALRLALSYKNAENIVTVNRYLMTAYYMGNENEKAIEQLKQMEELQFFKNPMDRIPLTGVALVSYAKLGQIERAKPYLQELLNFSSSRPELEVSQAYVYNYLIIYYLKVNQYKEAQRYCRINDRFCDKYSLLKTSADNHLWWSRADSALGNPDGALAHYKKGSTLRDSIFMGENRKQMSELQVKFETEKKEQNIRSLTRQTQLQEASLSQSRVVRNVLVGSALMLIALLLLGYSRYRIKQKANTQLQVKQEEINDKNTKLQRLVKEKEWLLKEIHHRVKNNLQIVMSLLNTQALYLNNKAAVDAIKESQQRMQAMSLIHQKLYQTDNVTSVAMQAYIHELIDYLKESVQDRLRIHFKEHVEHVDLDVSQAIPVGLILNEAITNAIKYAFPKDAAGIITVAMKLTDQKNVSLEISDDGIGLPVDFDEARNNSLGMNLMKGLASQLGGTLHLKNDQGLKIEIEFPYQAVTGSL